MVQQGSYHSITCTFPEYINGWSLLKLLDIANVCKTVFMGNCGHPNSLMQPSNCLLNCLCHMPKVVHFDI
uniref:Uncharacterized protein n=1 Tax=Nelumbo nucifera TaxID=4432 RepID=A0A822Z7P4_NELNU|nr:TPA_asm: hypothetical protein HUJ06_015200 [Nelumbo nucifera]